MTDALHPTLMMANAGWLLVSLLLHALFFVLPVLVLSYIAYFLLSLPARRQEQARLFLHVLDTCLREGRPVEQTLVSIAATQDRSPGLRFHLAAAYVEEGDRLAAALEKSRLLPRAVVAMLKAGEHIGDVRKVLPACHRRLQDSRSGLCGAMNYFLVLVLGLAPIALWLMWVLAIIVLPKMREVVDSMSGGEASTFWTDFLLVSLRCGVWVETTFVAGLFLAAMLYLCGPSAPNWLLVITARFVDRIAWLVPWKRRRMQRNFAGILAVLLDSGVPEPEALRLASAATDNVVFRSRTERAVQQLAAGEPLANALAQLDGAGEFRWRLTNAAHGGGGFVPALRGWLESLDARAFQQEQGAAHLLTTGLVVVNGVVVGCICAGVFGTLTYLIDFCALW
jgi:type II secretory pathway component PulF